VETALARYFPAALRERFADYMPRHPLRREIIGTHVTNSMVNRVGSTFIHRVMETTGAKPPEIVRAYLLAREVFDFVGIWKSIEALDNRVDDAVQSALLLEQGRLIERSTRWFLRSRRLADDMGATIAHMTPRVASLAGAIPALQDPADRTRSDQAVARYVAQRVPEDVARRVVDLDALYAALDIIDVAEARNRPLETIAQVYFEVATRLGLPWLRERIAALPDHQHWEGLAKGAMLDDLFGLQRTITAEVLGTAAEVGAPERLIASWADRSQRAMTRASQLLAELRAAPAVDAAMISVALRELRNLA
jgi:glutamate dehydrogenase